MLFLWRRGGLVNGGFRASIGEWSYPGVDLDEIYPPGGFLGESGAIRRGKEGPPSKNS